MKQRPEQGLGFKVRGVGRGDKNLGARLLVSDSGSGALV